MFKKRKLYFLLEKKKNNSTVFYKVDIKLMCKMCIDRNSNSRNKNGKKTIQSKTFELENELE